MEDETMDLSQVDDGLRTSRPPEGFRTVREWNLNAPADLSPFRNELAAELAGEGIQIGRNMDSVASKIVLIASELATNALTHGLPPTEVWLRRDGAAPWLLEVADHDASTPPLYAGTREPGAGGLGLHLARHLSLEVGWYTTSDTKNIWVTFV